MGKIQTSAFLFMAFCATLLTAKQAKADTCYLLYPVSCTNSTVGGDLGLFLGNQDDLYIDGNKVANVTVPGAYYVEYIENTKSLSNGSHWFQHGGYVTTNTTTTDAYGTQTTTSETHYEYGDKVYVNINNSSSSGGSSGGSMTGVSDSQLTSPLVFNAQYYMAHYPDVADAVGHDPIRAAQHWASNGAAEGRQGIMTFSAQQYLAMYPSEGTPGDYVNAIREFVANGADAGLVGLFALRPEVFSVENYLYYNADLQGAFNGNSKAVIKHWLQTGINEGRQASDTFKVTSYLAKNPQVAARVNGNNRTAIRNYILSGLDKGLDGTP